MHQEKKAFPLSLVVCWTHVKWFSGRGYSDDTAAISGERLQLDCLSTKTIHGVVMSIISTQIAEQIFLNHN